MRLPWEQHLVFSLKKKVLQTASRINSTLSRSFGAPVALNKQNDSQTRENRTITVDFQNEATYFQLLADGRTFVELVLAFILSIGFQLKHKATCSGGGCLTRHSHYMRVRLAGVSIWRLQCTTCKAVFTILPHFVLRYRSLHPDVARNALLATHGGLSLESCAVIWHLSPMALYRLVCAL